MSSSRPETSRPKRVLILGGSSEATELALRLRDHDDVAATLSLAGRTSAPPPLPIPARIGGFGGVGGLVDYLREHRIDVLVDATHPFATRITENAAEASRRAACRLLRVSRPGWTVASGDRWTEVADMRAAVAALGAAPRRVFLTIGSLNLAVFAAAPQHFYLVRTIDPVQSPPAFPNAHYVTARGPFAVAEERDLMRAHDIDALVTKNSGGTAAVAKLTAARDLGIDVVLVRRPAEGPVLTVAEALAAIEAHDVPA